MANGVCTVAPMYPLAREEEVEEEKKKKRTFIN
jgi:hypothetical protein